jgi:hypothetical protein
MPMRSSGWSLIAGGILGATGSSEETLCSVLQQACRFGAAGQSRHPSRDGRRTAALVRAQKPLSGSRSAIVLSSQDIGREFWIADYGRVGQPDLEVLDVIAADLGDRLDAHAGQQPADQPTQHVSAAVTLRGARNVAA